MNSKIISFAIEAHNNTNHLYDGKPYSVHLAMVAMIAQKHIDCIPEQAQSDVLSACWLHDTIEDCRLTFNDIKQVAGETVANIVYAVTNEKGKNRKERANDVYYDGIRKTMWAKYVKLCDRLANVQYSYDNMSRMYGVYQKENDAFLQSLFPNESEMHHYRDIVNDLKITMKKEQNFDKQTNPALRVGDVMGWRFLPEMPEEKKEVLVVFKWFDIPVQAYWDGKTWKASFEVRDVMKDGYCNDSTLCMQEDIYAWMELPVKPAYP